MLRLELPGARVAVENSQENPLLTEFCQRFPEVDDANTSLKLYSDSQGLLCRWQREDGSAMVLRIAIDQFLHQQRSFPAAKQGAFNQALGRKTNTVVDATGGWGADALLMCAQGYQVTILERHPLMALLLRDAMHRLASSEWARLNPVHIPIVIEVDARDYLAKPLESVDCVYLDPMYPPKRKKSAVSNKYMQFLQHLLGPDDSAAELAMLACSSGCRRVVVKRPDHAAAAHGEPSQRFSSKLVHYDVYLN